MEQIVDISPGGGLGQGSASSAGAADEDFTVFFALLHSKKSAGCRAEGECAAGWARQLMHAERTNASCRRRFALGLSGVGAVLRHGTEAHVRPLGSHRRASMSGRDDGRGGGLLLLAQGNACQYMCPFLLFLGGGLRGEGLGIPSPLLGCHSSCLRQEWCWRVRSSSWCFSSRAAWSVVGFFWLPGSERGAGEFWSAVRGCDTERDWILQVAVWRTWCWECRLLSGLSLPQRRAEQVPIVLRLWTSL